MSQKFEKPLIREALTDKDEWPSHQNGHAFRQIIDSTPLVSVDLLVVNTENEMLLGKRVNRPAQGFWFVPGGRIRKNETIEEAISRISLAELAIKYKRSDGRLHGVYDHIYEDNYWGDTEVNTHYVVLAFIFKLTKVVKFSRDEQHESLKWWAIPDLLKSDDVHENTKAYCLHWENL